MAQQTRPVWPECDQAGCIGIRHTRARMCLAHGDAEETAAALELIGETGIIEARGVPFTRGLLERVLTAAPRGENEELLIKSCQFDWATFSDLADFDGATFSGLAGFERATFNGDARFGGATFNGDARFGGATFSGDAWFTWATFSEETETDFNGATFSGDTEFGSAKFSHVQFLGATFSGDARFGRATFNGDARFGGATFSGDARFGGATVSGDARFGGAMFENARQFGPLLSYRELVLDDVLFVQPVQIEVSTTRICCRRARFPGGMQLRLRWACVVLDDTDLAAPSIIAGIPRLSSEELVRREGQMAEAWQQWLAGEISERPQVLSLRRANVAGLGLSNVSVADCRFAGAHNLDKLRLESDVTFASAPTPLGFAGRRWGGEEVIAEERAWRANRSRRRAPDSSSDPGAERRRWIAPWWPDWLDDQRPDVLTRGQIAGLYRALRKGREDAKDEPGAADFYYGEMEMRRRARRAAGPADSRAGDASRGRVERGILTAYWLVSGYSLRAWRAVVCLAVVTAILAFAFYRVGFTVPPRPVSYWTSLLYAFRATLSLTDDEVKLTAWGKLLQGVLRLTGPVLLGLALLALRGRVKR
ncbi:MAG: pentapeptide repeat-containing protein [Streptosporangiaceae bacterium]